MKFFQVLKNLFKKQESFQKQSSEDILTQIYESQKRLQLKYGHDFDKMTEVEKEQYTRDSILYLLEETHELLRETNFKTYKKVRKPINIEKIFEELVDIGCFYENLCACWGLDPQKRLQEYQKKNQINLSRFNDKTY